MKYYRSRYNFTSTTNGPKGKIAPVIPPHIMRVVMMFLDFPMMNNITSPKNKNPWIMPATVTAIGMS